MERLYLNFNKIKYETLILTIELKLSDRETEQQTLVGHPEHRTSIAGIASLLQHI